MIGVYQAAWMLSRALLSCHEIIIFAFSLLKFQSKPRVRLNFFYSSLTLRKA